MIVLSGAFHLLLGILALAVTAFQGSAIRLEPVAVVNLVGGEDFRPQAPQKPGPPPAAPEPAREPAPPPKKKAAEKAPAPPPKPVKKSAPRKRAPEVAAPDEFTTSKKRVPPDQTSVAERLRQMRESRADSDAVRKAVEEHRREAAARAAVRSIGERVAHRIEGPAAGPGAGGFGGGSQGSVRVAPELLEYFRKLEQRVRESWVLPEAVAPDAAKLIVVVRIVIEKDGRVSDTRIERGSGNAYFDESVQRAIRKASPLPIPPERLRGGEDYYEVGFRFHGTGGEG